MDKHPLVDMMEITMGKIREMVDVNTIVGAPITTPDGTTLIPVSKVSFGFASGGTDFQIKGNEKASAQPFGGGSGAGVNLTPAGAAYPYGDDPRDSNLRLAPTYPSDEDLEQACLVLAEAIKYVVSGKLLKG